jgi:pimeloyl-ACP methyl ester carboxylesterase
MFRCLLALLCFASFSFADTGIAKANGMQIWYETFGKKEDPALLLIMGGCCQGILWPKPFCDKLANEGFYVIRYDHRDAGLSTHVDYAKTPYDLSDMAEDALGLLDSLQIKKAHLVGLSMGGPIAELLAGGHPDRTLSLTLLMTSPDFRPANNALAHLPPEKGLLPGPKEHYIDMMDDVLKHPPTTLEEKIAQRVGSWNVLNGSKKPLNAEEQVKMHSEFLSRMQSLQGFENHIACNKKSEEIIRLAPYLVDVPTIILHGTEDPIFPPAHGKALAEAIKDSTFILVDGMGHVPNAQFYDLYIQSIKKVAGKNG